MSHFKSNTTLNNFYNVSSTSLTIKYFSSVLPYRVIEALSASNLSLKNLSARITRSGWVWFVVGRKLFVWRYLDDETGNKPKASKCYELLLPPSDIAHKAELVCILSSLHQGRFPCALAVSPEGSIRYWPNISQENNTFDSIVTTDLNGQECQILIDIQPLGCILGTTTNSLVHICIDVSPGEPSQSPIIYHTLKTPQGLFSGIGRKFSSFIFGSLPNANYLESRQLIRLIRNEAYDDNDDVLPIYILVLFNCSIQKWYIEDYNIESFCGEIDLEKHLKESFINKFWNRTTTHHNQLSIWIMDIALNRFNEILLLSMCNNTDVPNENYFALITLSTDIFPSDGSMIDQTSNSIIKSFRHLRNISLCNKDLSHPINIRNSILSSQNRLFNLISEINYVNKQVCYIYNSAKLYRINLDSEQDSIEEVDFRAMNDFLLGTVVFDQNLLLFTFKNGFISVQKSKSSEANHPKQLSSSDRELVHMNQVDNFSKLKRALNLFIKEEKTRAQLLVQEIFPFLKSNETKKPNNMVELDETVCAISADICDHIPNADPRWSTFIEAESSYDNSQLEITDGDSIGSVIITNQLEEKLSTHNSFIELLKRTNAWDSLTSLTNVKSIFPTKLILCEHTEKLLVCIALRKLHPKFGNIIESAIKKVLEKRKLSGKLLEYSHLTNQDLFYREVTKVDDLFWDLVEIEELQLNLDHSSPDEHLLISITELITDVFAGVCLYRQENGIIYKSAAVTDCDYVPWSSDQHVSGIRETWLKQFDLLIKCFRIDSKIHMINGDEDRWTLIGQKLANLADIILDNFICQLSYLNPNTEKFATLRRAFEMFRYKCLKTLLLIKQYERTALLAEKYEDFDILIKLCEELNNQDQLQQYSQRFADKGFSEYLFEWYLKEGKQGKMLSSSTVTNNYKLDEFLSNHESLKWLHQLHLKKFKEASSTLKKLSLLEEKCPGRKRTMLSIGKLALIASGDLDYTDFDDQLRFLNYQFDLSESLLRKNNLDSKTIKVLPPKQLVEILISGADGPNEEMNNFHKALEIAEVVEKHYSIKFHRQIVLKIWQKAFEKDGWSEYNTDNLELFITRSFFYQLAISYYGNESKKLPDLNTLLENFSFVKENQKVGYFLRATYEMILNN